MTYRWLTDLDQAFMAAGVDYVEVPASAADATGAASWRTRGRPASTGSFDVQGVLCHHTASPAGTPPANDLRVILAGNSEAPGPIAQLYIGRDALLYLVAAGRANHGGRGRRPGVDTGGCADMNALLIGIEVGNNGVGEPWSDAVTDLYGSTVAALCEWYGWPTSAVFFHATTGPPNGGCNSKIDPAGPWQRQATLTRQTWDLPTWLAFVDEHRAGSASGPTPPPTNDESEAANMAGTYVVSYDAATGLPDGAVFEIVHGARRNVSSDEWFEVIKGVMADRNGAVPPHDPWQPVAFVTNGWMLAGMPEWAG